MLKYEYENATVYITKPTEAHIANIKKATEKFLKQVMKEQIQNDSRRNNRGTGRTGSDARKRNSDIKNNDRQN